MTRLLATTAVALSLAGVTPAFAVQEHHADAQASASPSAIPTGDPADRATPAATASQLLDNAKRLQEEAQRIAAANTDTERQRLLQQHIHTLRMSMMLSSGIMSDSAGQSGMPRGTMGSAGMMGGGMDHGTMGGGMGHGTMGGGVGHGMMGGGMSHGMMGGGMGPGMMGGGMGPGMMGGGSGPGMMTMMIVMMDTNGDGALSLEEVQAVHARMFKYADSDKDGKLTREELQGFLRGGTNSDDD
ncbi:MAG TPA: EF-hand domain-containing protein [Burkholderiaceae bacterium]|nr:EF-hand domain-containing protein [Burkholderiaceae bacterium]